MESIVATAVSLLCQMPPADASVKFAVVPMQMFAGPLTADGLAITVTITVDRQPSGKV